jgi:hypothetical protein
MTDPITEIIALALLVAIAATALVVVAILYFLPSVIALTRRTETAPAVLVLNTFLGWTFLGWVASLALSVSGTANPPPPRTRRPVAPPPTAAAAGPPSPAAAHAVQPVSSDSQLYEPATSPAAGPL